MYHKQATNYVTLNCVISDATSLIWKHNKDIVTIDNKKYSGGILTSTSLHIVNLTRTDRGTYTCQSSYDDVTVTGQDITLDIDGMYTCFELSFNRILQDT